MARRPAIESWTNVAGNYGPKFRLVTADVRIATPEDYDDIAAVLDIWWGRSMPLPRLFLDHFYETSLVTHDTDGLVCSARR
jgi:hypothetical protein